MEFRISPRGATPLTTASEVDELNNILEAERRLVVKTQENYKQLKHKFLVLKEENEVMVDELEKLRSESAKQARLKKELEELEKKSRAVVRRIEEDGQEREVKYEQFRTSTLAELQRVFRKELADQNLEMERLGKEKEELIEENDRLIGEMRKLKTELTSERNSRKRREAEITEEFSKQIEELVTQFNKKGVENRAEEEGELISSLRQKVVILEEQLTRTNENRMTTVSEKCHRISQLEARLLEEKQETAKISTILERCQNEILVLKNALNVSQNEQHDTRKRMNGLLREKVEDNIRNTERDRRQSQTFDEHALSFEEKLSELEHLSRTKDSFIDELQKKLDDTRINDVTIQEIEMTSSTEREQREKLEQELRRLQMEMERRSFESGQQLVKLKLERNSLEENVAELKKRLESSPETIAEIGKLRTQLRQKEDELRKMKDHYRELLRRMKTSLTNLEKRHRKTQQKLENGILL